MADNFDFTEGSGKTGAADEVSNVLYPRVKLDIGTDGVGAPVLGGAGAVAAGVPRVTLASNDPAVALLITIDSDTNTIQSDTTSIDGKITACNTGAVVLATGSAAIGKLAANSGVDIGDVDVASIVPGTAATNLGKAEDTGHSTGDVGVMALSVRQDTAAALSGTDADYQPLITDANGRLHVLDQNSAAIKTSVEIMDDWDATHASAAPVDGAQVMGAAYGTALPTDVGADADAARICTDRHGRILAGLMPQNFQATFTSADAQAAAPVKVKTASRRMFILSLVVSVDTEMSVQFQDDTGPTVLIEGMYFAANGGAHLTWPPEAPLIVSTNEDFDIITSAAGNVSVTITGYLAI